MLVCIINQLWKIQEVKNMLKWKITEWGKEKRFLVWYRSEAFPILVCSRFILGIGSGGKSAVYIKDN